MLGNLQLEALVGLEFLKLFLNQRLHHQILFRTVLELFIHALVFFNLAFLDGAFLCLKACHLVYQV